MHWIRMKSEYELLNIRQGRWITDAVDNDAVIKGALGTQSSFCV